MIYFISGHRDITEEEFKKNYKGLIEDAILYDKHCQFVVGDCDGADKMAMDLIAKVFTHNMHKKDIPLTIYHMYDTPRNTPEVGEFRLKGGYTSDIERDSAMTNESNWDIAFVREGKFNSGTAQNLLRRFRLK
jgi:hypothetical protein